MTAPPVAEGVALWARCREAVLARKRKFNSYYLFAVLPAGAGPAAPVPVVLRVPDLGKEEVDRVRTQGEWKCTLRELLWEEGLSAAERAALRDTAHLDVTQDTKLCELDAGLGVPVWGLLGLLCCTGLFIGALFRFARRTQRG